MWSLVPLLMALTKMATSKTIPVDFTSKTRQNEAPFPFDIQNVLNDLDSSNESPARRPEIDIVRLSPSQEWDELDSKFQSILQELTAQKELNDNQLDDSTSDEVPEFLEEQDDAELERLSRFLIKALQNQGSWQAPLVFMKEPVSQVLEDPKEEPSILKSLPTPWKRSLYYRRYPWKRQTSRYRNSYDYDASRYLCTPTREDVFQLLIALHDARQGNKTRIVNFCNRRRPAGAIFTNIRFLGRRK